MNPEIKRRIEQWMCEELKGALPAFAFYPAKGGGDTGRPGEKDDATVIKPPFCVVQCEEAESRVSGESIWQGNVNVVYVTHKAQATSPEHSEKVQQIYQACCNLSTGWKPKQSLTVNGSDVIHTDDFTDEKAQAHGDVIMMAVGASL